MKRLIPVMFLGLISLAAVGIQINQPNSEISLQDNQLKIICPKCGYVFYNCNVEELFEGEPVHEGLCYPVNSKTPLMHRGNFVICPFDKTEAVRNSPCAYDPIGCSQIFTNKGWMPQRKRPA